MQGCVDLAPRAYGPKAALTRIVQALVACEQGDDGHAEPLCAEAAGSLADLDHYGWGLRSSALRRVALHRGNSEHAIDRYRDALSQLWPARERFYAIEAVESLAWALAADGQAVEAARLLACAARQRKETGMVVAPVDRPCDGRALSTVRAALGAEAFAQAWTQGERLALGQGIVSALSDDGSPGSSRKNDHVADLRWRAK